MIDWVSFKHRPVSIDFSPDGRYFATAHENSLGVFLWLVKSYFTPIVINKTPSCPRKIKGFDVKKGKNFYSRKVVKVKNLVSKPLEETAQSVVSLKMPAKIIHNTFKVSELPYSRVMALYHLDEIKERNAPVQPPKKPEKVPFFLPDSLGIVSAPVSSTEQAKAKLEHEKESDLSGVLQNSAESIVELLKSFTPDKIELNLYGLVTQAEIDLFVEFLYKAIESKKNFEFIQSVLSCFLKIHSASVSKEQAQALANIQRKVWEEIENLLLFDISGIERLID
jgi:U3 small nucleolar RNA-associated protein 21